MFKRTGVKFARCVAESLEAQVLYYLQGSCNERISYALWQARSIQQEACFSGQVVDTMCFWQFSNSQFHNALWLQVRGLRRAGKQAIRRLPTSRLRAQIWGVRKNKLTKDHESHASIAELRLCATGAAQCTLSRNLIRKLPWRLTKWGPLTSYFGFCRGCQN